MNRLIRLFSTSIGRKLIMAVTGLILLLWLLGHMLGNMALFQGSDEINSYAAWLQGHPSLWVMRLSMLMVLGIHIYVAIVLALENRSARSTGYATRNFQTSGASRYMVVTGLLVVVFLVYHILHLTVGVVAPEFYGGVDSAGHHDVYSMVVRSFQNPVIAGSYIVAMMLVATHLIHGSRSLFQTIGVNHESYNGSIRLVSHILVVLFVLGNCSMPILVLTGVIGLEAR
jgi:succinate dehydrogenase / fumarate reductase cytochrome b subunit